MLVGGGTTLGALTVHDDQSRAWTDGEIDAALLLADGTGYRSPGYGPG